VCERDETPLPPSPVEAFTQWERRGAPQMKHSHAFLARLRNLLRDRLPDVLAELLAAGAEELPLANLLRPGIDDASPRPGDEDLTLLACRRATFEWVLRRAVERQAGIDFRGGCDVAGLLVEPAHGLVRAVGLRVARARHPEELRADLVVDATGRRSGIARWLRAAGLPELLVERSEPCGIFYCSRFYRLRPGVTPPERDTTIGADLGHLKYAIFHGDSRIFSITFAAAPEDKALRALLRERPFEAAARALPATARWTVPDLAEPITPVYGMDGLRNTWRSLRPGLQGLVALGDAAVHTNPLYGRGCTFALVHAFLLVDALAAHADEPVAAAAALEAATKREIAPWFEQTLLQDRDASAWAAQLRGEAPAPPRPGSASVDPRAYMRDLIERGLIPALRLDATVLRAFARGFNLLAPPGELMRQAEVLQRVLAVYRARGARREPSLGPGRAELVSLLAAA
jgi:2-polyprenyl-6-methoxyphenol hydroxylase-like FAD-dependent oxidoreductase